MLTMHCDVLAGKHRRRVVNVELSDRRFFRTYRSCMSKFAFMGRMSPYRIGKSLKIGTWTGDLKKSHWKEGAERCFVATIDKLHIYFMWDGTIRRGERIEDIEDDWADTCMICGKEAEDDFLCCENSSCTNTCCPECLSPHGRLAAEGKLEDFFCGKCMEECDGACEEGCGGCSLELEATKEATCLKVWTGDLWQPSTVIEFLPAGQADASGVRSLEPFHHLQIGTMRKWMHLTVGPKGNQYSKFVADGVGGWKL
jgi:hypothetical protein